MRYAKWYKSEPKKHISRRSKRKLEVKGDLFIYLFKVTRGRSEIACQFCAGGGNGFIAHKPSSSI